MGSDWQPYTLDLNPPTAQPLGFESYRSGNLPTLQKAMHIYIYIYIPFKGALSLPPLNGPAQSIWMLRLVMTSVVFRPRILQNTGALEPECRISSCSCRLLGPSAKLYSKARHAPDITRLFQTHAHVSCWLASGIGRVSVGTPKGPSMLASMLLGRFVNDTSSESMSVGYQYCSNITTWALSIIELLCEAVKSQVGTYETLVGSVIITSYQAL